jgi:ketosteroid isomerase-like protein
MSSENVEAVRRHYEALSEGQHPVAIYDPEVEIRVSSDWTDADVFRGLEGLAQLRARLIEPWEEYRQEPEEYIEVDQHVIAVCREYARGKNSGAHVEQTLVVVWTMQDGRAVLVRGFRTKDEALQAVGVPR